MITISDGNTTITLPPDLIWADELWSPVAQAAEYSLGGSLLVETGLMLAGRPVTLTGDDRHSWVKRETLLALQDYAAKPGAVFTLTMHGDIYSVIMRHQDKAIEAEPIFPAVPFTSGQWFNNFTLRLQIVGTI